MPRDHGIDVVAEQIDHCDVPAMLSSTVNYCVTIS